MKRQVTIGFGILAGSLILVLAVLWCLPPRTGVVRKANFDRIENGMPIEDVGRLFGKEAPDAWVGPGRAIALWVGADSAAAEVEFADNRVSGATWCDSPEDLWDRACRLLGIDDILPPIATATAVEEAK